MDKSIPKVLHYCWFGGAPKPNGVLKCIESWQRACPEYKIIEWNENNFDIHLTPYTAQAHQQGKWAFVSDVARLYALVNHGGIYLDTDVELLRPFNEFLNNDAFAGFEGTKYVATAVMGCQPGNKMMRDFLQSYRNSQFINSDGLLDMSTNVDRLTRMLVDKGLTLDGSMQTLDDIKVYPTDFFSPHDYINGRLNLTANTIAIHWYSVSWLGSKPFKRRLTQFYHRLIGQHRP